jgi:hypothetical protein
MIVAPNSPSARAQTNAALASRLGSANDAVTVRSTRSEDAPRSAAAASSQRQERNRQKQNQHGRGRPGDEPESRRGRFVSHRRHPGPVPLARDAGRRAIR